MICNCFWTEGFGLQASTRALCRLTKTRSGHSTFLRIVTGITHISLKKKKKKETGKKSTGQETIVTAPTNKLLVDRWRTERVDKGGQEIQSNEHSFCKDLHHKRDLWISPLFVIMICSVWWLVSILAITKKRIWRTPTHCHLRYWHRTWNIQAFTTTDKLFQVQSKSLTRCPSKCWDETANGSKTAIVQLVWNS